ncbi:Alpha-latrotoxin [Dactylella cylindrospora]|nr:Alpha-latrotoxin [Dactylella cylindrospora]
MMSAHRELRNALPKETVDDPSDQTGDIPTPLVCHFFFKKGDQDIQHTRTGLESILHQLLNSNELRKNTATLAATVEVLNPRFGDTGLDNQKRLEFADFLESQAAMTDAIRRIAEAIPERVYFMIDALDECQDRREQGIVQAIKSIVRSKTDGVRVILSARDSIDIKSELIESGDPNDPNPPVDLPENIQIIDITAEKNSRDLTDYLRHDVGRVLTRRIDREAFKAYFDSELARIVKIIHHKAKGDFTLARMIIANLQQPSKDSLERKIQKLPAAIGDIYLASLESLTPDEQELAVSALKWVVWSVSGITVIEISDHYRELYNGTSVHSVEETAHGESVAEENGDENAVAKPVYTDPYEDPEVKEIIYHLGNAGRDFFKFDRNTGLVSVDVSIREWIREDGSPKSAIREARGFNKYRDPRGNTVFKFTLTPYFVRYGDTLAELFNEREAQLSITIDILRALNNRAFQEKYMPWQPRRIKDEIRGRYEVDHWQDHLRIIQQWWTKDSPNDRWWSELLNQLSIFMQPHNWYRWNINRRTFDYPRGKYADEEWLLRFFDSPAQIASNFGLHMMIDRLAKENGIEDTIPTHSQELKNARLEALKGFYLHWQGVYQTFQIEVFLSRIEYPECISFLIEAFQDDDLSYEYTELTTLLYEMEPELRVAILALLKLSEAPKCCEAVEDIIQAAVEESWHETLGDEIEDFLNKHERDSDRIRTKIEELTPEKNPSTITTDVSIWDRPNHFGETPLHMAAGHPETLKCLIRYGADINKETWQRWYNNFVTPVQAVFLDICNCADEEEMALLLQSARGLILEGADLTVTLPHGATLLHQAALVRDLNLFKLLCVSGDWDVHAVDDEQMTPMHYLFTDGPPASEKLIKETLDICKIMLKMRSPDGDDLVNAQDRNSENPLAYAVKTGFVEAVKLLINLGADVHDDNTSGENCFHKLSKADSDNPEAITEIANILFDAGVDCTKPSNSQFTPLSWAVYNHCLENAKFLLRKYSELARESSENNPLLILDRIGCSLIDRAAEAGGSDKEIDPTQWNELFDEILSVLSDHVDIGEYLKIPSQSGITPLHSAVMYRNMYALEKILEIQPNVSQRDAAGVTALDLACQLVAQDAYDSSKAIAKAEKRLPATIKMFSEILMKGTNLSFSFLETRTFDKAAEGDPLELLDMNKITAVLELPFRDSHGWSLFDAISANERDHLIQRLSNKFPSPPEEFARPSRIGEVLTTYPDVSEDGLECTMAPEQLLPQSFDMLKLVADHPVPPVDQVFYFEFQVPEFRDTKIYSSMRITPVCSIGVRSILEQNWQASKGGISITNTRDIKREGKTRPWTHAGGLREKHDWKSGSIGDKVMGCGMNPVKSFVFFTVNGELLEEKWEVSRRTCFPTVEVNFPYETFRLNFGAEPFLFEQANNAEWLKQGEVQAEFVALADHGLRK